MMTESNHITKRTLADEVATKLQEQIVAGRYKINDKLPIEPELMKQFGVGRSSIREAIKLLTNAGLLRVQQGLGTFVQQREAREPMDSRMKRANMKDLDEVRQLLEMKIAEKAAQNRTEKDLKRINLLLEARGSAAREGRITDCIEADIQFHIAIAEAAKNDILTDLYRSASVHLKQWFSKIYKDTSTFIATHKMHKDLLQHITAGHAQKAWLTAEKIISFRSN